MPARSAAVVALRRSLLAGVLAASGCIRLTFVRPERQRAAITSAPRREVDVSDDDAQASRHGAARRMLLLAQQQLRAGRLAAAEAEARQALKLDPRLGRRLHPAGR